MSSKVDYLQEVEIFEGLQPEEVADIGQQTTMAHYQGGHLFYMPGDRGEVLFMLKQGRVQLYRISPDGRKLVVASLLPGAIFGQMALVGQRMHNTFAEAVDDCVICVMNRLDIERLLIAKPQVALRFMDALGKRLLHAEQQLEEITFKRMPARMAGLLLRLNDENGAADTLKGYTHQELAEMLGTYRETATQILNELQHQELIRLGRKSIEILDGDGLNKIAVA